MSPTNGEGITGNPVTSPVLMSRDDRTGVAREAGLAVEGVSKSFGPNEVLRNVSLSVPRGELHALLGASGSGKTTLLRIVGGFTEADSGSVLIDGADVTWNRPETRNAGFVFQNYALFPHLSIYENIAFGLRLRKVDKRGVREAVASACDLTQVPRSLLARKPNEVSGGQQQRIAIARALATRPAVLLLDEPLSALDRKVRQEVREELKRVQHESGITTIFVTHDQEEALYLADRVLVMADGAIVQSGRGPQLYGKPQSEFVAGFVGSVNLLPADLEWLRDGTVAAGVRIGSRTLRVPGCVPSESVREDRAPRGLMAVRPEQLLLTPLSDEPPIGPSQAVGEVEEIDFTGPTATVRVDVGDRFLTVLVFSRDVLGGAVRVGQRVAVAIAPGVILLADSSGSGGHGAGR